jgi:metal-responsive CopG/Arc/MetJ family transcriptional regulator
MSTSKVAITLDEKTLTRLDRLVQARVFPNRSKAIQDAVEEKLGRIDRRRLARESSKLEPKFEKTLAEEGLSEELAQWSEYRGVRSIGPTRIQPGVRNKPECGRLLF